MRIVGSKNREIDADLLARLAVDRASGKTVSKAEVQKAISSAVADLKDHFEGETSVRGLTKMTRAVQNTLELAVQSGWVKGGTARAAIESFLDGSGKNSLDKVESDIRAEVKANAKSDTSYGYGGYTSTVTYSPRGGSRVSTYAGT